MPKCCNQKTLFILGAILICLVCRTAQSQQPLPADGTTGADSASASTPMGMDMALPASRIIGLLREKPELLIELKKVTADKLQAQGVPVQEDSITDELLFGKITTDQKLRSDITLWLRARGYVSDADILQSKAGSLDADEQSQDQYGQMAQSLPRLPSEYSDQAAAASDTRTDELTSVGATGDRTSATEMVPSNRTARVPASQMANGAAAPPERDPNAASSPEVLHRPTPFNLLSMRDLYTQVPDQSSSLRRFGSDAFLSRGMGSKATSSFDLPVGPDYVLGSGDSINIDLWGGLSQRSPGWLEP
jgi:polysaccharide biosynthesis/export protein